MNAPTRRTVDCLDVPLPGGRAVRLALYSDPDGTPDTLVVAAGWGRGREWREDRDPARGQGLEVPAECLPDLRAALDALTTAGPPPLRAA